ncbi:DUF2868 domain-containing protein [Alcanivorax sp.]|uniref:DUF2868 domain-containing protein n=1 Tax=Alcanivorax sp. TaxID=1872427 RepID=UPI00199F5920|nr:DUF2868 domain-containing protein [Alcanivorax sp.]MBD3645841.1 DUF2868 domain-containing protein [Alcanivorax sp.]
MPKALTLLLDFDDQYRRDVQQSHAFLHRRDRRFAQQQEDQKQPLTVPAWLAALHALNGQRREADADPRLRHWRQASWVFAGLGALLGAGFMLGLLWYDGSRQINLTLLIGLVALQLLLALFTSMQAWLGWQPWGSLLGPRQGEDPLAALRPALCARIAHTGGLLFAISGLLTLLALVVVQDLAFGWSTTLQTSAEGYHRMVAALAQPWQSLWPAAVPSAELVNASQFYRLADIQADNPALLGTWWPFVLMLWLVYVLLPRMVLLMLAALQLRWQAGRALRAHPGWQGLFYRFETPWVETRGQEDSQPAPAAAKTDLSPLPDSATLIHWAGAAMDAPGLLPRLSRDPAPLQCRAGGNNSLEEDARVLEQTGARNQPVILVTRGWEPPTGELSDFIVDARDHWSAATLLALVPLADEQGAALTDAGLLAQWQRFVDRQGDSQLLLCAPREQDQP